MLDDDLGQIRLKLPAYCDSFTHKKGTITPDRFKGDFFDYSTYTYSTTNKNNFPKLTVSFKHHPIDDANTDLKFDSTSCLEFLSNNRNFSWFLTAYSIERNCFYINKRYFASEIGGVQEETENGINVRAYTGIGRRFLITNIRMTSQDTTGIYSKVLEILHSVSIN